MQCDRLMLMVGLSFLTLSRFFFLSRRQHMICLSDWSSDVCSSDLPDQPVEILNVRSDIIGIRNTIKYRSQPFGNEDPAPALKGTRPAHFEGLGFINTKIYSGPRSEERREGKHVAVGMSCMSEIIHA